MTLEIALLWSILASTASVRAAELDWPLQIRPRSITGTFMEPRSAHFHSGLDIRTQGRIGIPVYAPADGTLQRVRCSPEGYGKALYLALDDGRTLVFAHLSAFADPVQRLLTGAQASSRRYGQDLRPSAAEAPRFRRGELLALSGATGIGAPHLHLELRGRDGLPRNPLLFGFEPDDTRAPQISAFRLLPMDADSRVEGRARSFEAAAEDTLSVSGRIGVQLQASDTTQHANFSLMPARVQLYLDEELVYALSQERFDFSESGQMRLEIDRDEGSRWMRLYRREGNRLGAREGASGFTVEFLPDGATRRLECVVADAAGNTTRAGLWLRCVDSRPVAQKNFDLTLAGGAVQFGEAVCEIRASTAPQGGRPLAEELYAASCANAAQWLRESGMSGILVGGEAFDALQLGHGYWASNPDGGATFPGGLLRVVESAPVEAASLPEGCSALTPAVELRSHGLAFADELEIQWESDGRPETGVGLFQRSGRGEWKWMGSLSQARSAGEAATIDRPGWIVAMRDTQAPRLGPWRLENGEEAMAVRARTESERTLHEGLRQPRWPSLVLRIAESGSGIDPDGIFASVDGERFPARFDPEGGVLALDWHVELAPGKHLAEIEVRDRAGNAARSRHEFRLLP